MSPMGNQYHRDAILSASPARLVTMLYDRMLLDLHRAEAAQDRGDWVAAHENLTHAQAILAELTSSLTVDAWNGGAGLLALYTYVSTALVGANVYRDVRRTRESITLLEPLRLAWHEAADELAAATPRPAYTGGTLGVA